MMPDISNGVAKLYGGHQNLIKAQLIQFLATLAAFLLVAEALNLVKQEDLHKMKEEMTQVRARVDVIGIAVQTEMGIVIFWDTMESAERGIQEVPSGPRQ